MLLRRLARGLALISRLRGEGLIACLQIPGTCGIHCVQHGMYGSAWGRHNDLPLLVWHHTPEVVREAAAASESAQTSRVDEEGRNAHAY